MLVPKYVSQPAAHDSVAPSVEPVGAQILCRSPLSGGMGSGTFEKFLNYDDGRWCSSMAEGNDLDQLPETPGVVVLVDYVSLLEPGLW